MAGQSRAADDSLRLGRGLRNPLPDGLAAGGHFCFYPDKVDIEVDGEPLKE